MSAHTYNYTDVVFLQGDEGREVTDKLYHVDGVVAYGADTDSIAEAIEHLSQWDSPDLVEQVDAYPFASSDDQWQLKFLGTNYVLTANRGLGYAGLIRVSDEVADSMLD